MIMDDITIQRNFVNYKQIRCILENTFGRSARAMTAIFSSIYRNKSHSAIDHLPQLLMLVEAYIASRPEERITIY